MFHHASLFLKDLPLYTRSRVVRNPFLRCEPL